MGAVVEVKYFNSFVAKKSSNGTDIPSWYGSWGIPSNLNGGFDTSSATPQLEDWTIEEARIRGGYNNTTVDFSPRAYLVENEPAGYIRFNALIYSGIFNSRTGINDTNVFSTAQDITKATDPANGSIQKLYAEDTNLFLLQEYKISRALIDKDAIYSAEGGGAVTSSNLVIGVIQPLPGKYGISKNPESFAVYGNNKYFTDKNNNVVLSLRGSSIVEISQLGMRDFFRDKLNELNSGSTTGIAIGGWDIYNQQYVLSLQQSPIIKSTPPYETITFDEGVQGWTSLFDYKPDQVMSLKNNMYTTSGESLYQHYIDSVPRAQFYGVDYTSSITVVFNPEPVRSKIFSTISYEGSNGWELTSLVSTQTGSDQNPVDPTQYQVNSDSITSVLSYYGGEYVFNGTTPVSRGLNGAGYLAVFGTRNPALPRYHAGFSRKENAYVANIINNSGPMNGEIIFGNAISGIKGYYTTATFSTDNVTNVGGAKILFSVGAKFDSSNGY
jgi:hypothetical protein